MRVSHTLLLAAFGLVPLCGWAQDIPTFCRETALYGLPDQFSILPAGVPLPPKSNRPEPWLAWTKKYFPKLLDGTDEQVGPVPSAAELERAAVIEPERIFGDRWMLSTYPNTRVRKVGFDEKISGFGDFASFKNAEEAIDFLQNQKTGVEEYRSRIRFDIMEGLDPLRNLKEPVTRGGPGTLDAIQAKSAGICLLYFPFNPMDARDCAEAINRIIKTMTPRGDIMALPVIATVLKDPSYKAGASLAAIKIVKRALTGDLDGSLFEDIRAAYKESGLTESSATEHAWNLIAVYAARGPNMFVISQFGTPANVHTLVALDILSSAAPYLDQLRLDKGQPPYSYPREVQTKCSYGKPYHFWMSAFLARRMSREVKNPKAGLYAAYLSELGYQMFSDTSGRDPDRAFMVDAFHPANNKIRVDLAFAAAGAVYGMRESQERSHYPLKIDVALSKMIQQSSPQKVMTKAQVTSMRGGITGAVSAYQRWKAIFAPDSALDFYLSVNP